MEEKLISEVLSSIFKKANGYVSEECVNEYATVDGELVLQKRKVTQKEVPPDVSAAKMLVEITPSDPYADMSEEELEREKTKLLLLLKEKQEQCK